jgi:NAD(P)-dependent dehydrogenase (short-subunit alcohol dehydrogenase family)
VTITIDHADRRVLVAGADRSLGQAIAQSFRAQGATVVEALTRAQGNHIGVEANRKFVRDAIVQLGGLDILVTYTGIEAVALIDNATLDTWEVAFSQPLKATFFTTQAALSALKSSRGSIVNVTSVLGQMGAPAGLAIPAAAMACVVHHTRMMALRLSKDAVRVNCVCHGYLCELESTGVPQGSHKSSPASVANSIPLGRLAHADDIVNAVMFLASPLADYITGAILSADGGTYAGG